MNTLVRMLLCGAVILVVGCSTKTEDEADHVWKSQTDTIEKAKEVENLLLDASKKQRHALDQ